MHAIGGNLISTRNQKRYCFINLPVLTSLDWLIWRNMLLNNAEELHNLQFCHFPSIFYVWNIRIGYHINTYAHRQCHLLSWKKGMLTVKSKCHFLTPYTKLNKCVVLQCSVYIISWKKNDDKLKNLIIYVIFFVCEIIQCTSHPLCLYAIRQSILMFIAQFKNRNTLLNR